MSKLKITDTSLRDAHQSLWATRMATADMIPVLEKLDNIGYHSLEIWGGATFDVCIRYLNEDPWERLREIRRNVSRTKLQMLVRGQSLVGYTHYPDDIAVKFIEKAAENGIDVFRIFDALNDLRNLKTCMKTVKEIGKHAQACVVYTISPVHSVQHFVDTALRLRDMGADSICVKDMAGLLAPYVSYELIRALKANLDVPIHLHTHYIGGLAIATLLKAAEAGVDIIDTASVPMAFGSSQPPVETIVRALQDTPWDTGLNLHDLFGIAEHFEQIRKHKGFERGVTRITDMKVFEHQVPGGMISNFYSQLEEQKAADRLDEVLQEIPRVRADLGYAPLVTPTSQIIGIQAVLNVLLGERYKMCPGEVKDYVRGCYGNPPAPISEEIRRIIIGDTPMIDVRPADLLEPIWEKAKHEVNDWAESEEDIITYALFPQVALKFFEWRRARRTEDMPQIQSSDGVGSKAGENQDPVVPMRVKPPVKPRPVNRGDENMNIDEIRELMLLLDQSNIADLELQKNDFKIRLRKVESAAASSTAPHTLAAVPKALPVGPVEETVDESLTEILAPMVGTFYAAPSPDAAPYVKVGDRVQPGQTLCILEAMKLMNEIKTDFSGTIVNILVENTQPVEYGQTLFLIQKD
ncbi:MAG: acetyl-CoA carboxylase biotin carboxyl carrier protein [Syntrophomonadaceae bacterium]|jgi:oxaloacetate decarboxylase alpha subunit